ncbi:uncharacterized protein LOC129809848 [Phlebotomus papatasi]|uniref:uncharacterized protein LOC129809848 n=1 Tax=Phlebotomus papatasi TaxID=29031 RepID=UPI0024841942|nr:uncharacterized protein LOC129809848 [Phlebotomus papatasi]
MTQIDSQEDDLEVSAQEFNKITSIHHKSGYKDGISDGREQKFQEGFDAGFRDGFHHAFLVGKYKALAWEKEQKKEKEKEDVGSSSSSGDFLLKNPHLGHCQICLDPTLLEKNLGELQELNANHTEKIHKRIEEKFRDLRDLRPDPGK